MRNNQGDGHRYSVTAFATYFEINREVNANIPFLPFNKGMFLINVTRRDDLDFCPPLYSLRVGKSARGLSRLEPLAIDPSEVPKES